MKKRHAHLLWRRPDSLTAVTRQQGFVVDRRRLCGLPWGADLNLEARCHKPRVQGYLPIEICYSDTSTSAMDQFYCRPYPDNPPRKSNPVDNPTVRRYAGNRKKKKDKQLDFEKRLKRLYWIPLKVDSSTHHHLFGRHHACIWFPLCQTPPGRCWSGCRAMFPSFFDVRCLP